MDALLELSKRLKQAGGSGRGSLRSEMHKAVKKAAQPLPKAVQEEAGRRLPQRGGLAKEIAKRKPKVSLRTGMRTGGVRIRDDKTDRRINDQGRIAHPVFGRPRSTVVQFHPGSKGYFSEPLEAAAPQIRDDITDVMADFAQRLLRGI